MCDTLYLGPGGGQGPSFFAKNSDRHPEEPQALCLVTGSSGSLALPQGPRPSGLPEARLAFVLSRPSWMAGGEMGLNEAGLAVGNEAVFSRFKAKREGVLGMEILRSALGQARSAAEARDFILGFVETRDQGGNGAFRGSLVYSNSFIVADPREAFVVETAGRRWAWKRAGNAASISNAYSLDRDYEDCDPRTRAELGDGGWRGFVQDSFYLLFTKGERRRACTTAALQGKPEFESLLAALRGHGDRGGRGMGSVCLHEAGFPVKSTSTASLLVEYRPLPAAGEGASAILWFTGTPHPCLSVFAPFLLRRGGFVPLWKDYDLTEGSAASYGRWEEARRLQRELGGAARAENPVFREARDACQIRLRSAALRALEAADGSRDAAAAEEVGAALASWEAFLRSQVGTRP